VNKQELIKEYELHHFNGDPEALEILLAAVVANFMDGAPVWLLFIGASGAGKSSIIEMFDAHETTLSLDDLSDKAMQSGLEGKAEEDNLVNMLDGRIGLISDFAQIISAKDSNILLSQLRRIYDGSLTKAWGSSKPMANWKGKVGLVCASTDAIDHKMKVFQELGERFNRVNLKGGKEARKQASKMAIRNLDRKSEIKRSLKSSGHKFLDHYISIAREGGVIILEKELQEKIRVMADVTAILRTPIQGVKGGGFEHIPEAEYGTRLGEQLGMIAKANALLDGESMVGIADIELASRVAMDAIPRLRTQIVSALLNKEVSQVGIIRFANMPKKSVQRALDELQALNVIHYPKPRVIALTPDIYENLVESSLSKKILAQYPRIEF
tara:strand:- start:381 stop:1529 length:1149 start_codon:yes stop_codon:yes gene_type:complete